jgi:hypothetical protein
MIYRTNPVRLIATLSMAIAAICSSASFAGDTEPYARVIESDSGLVALEMAQKTFVPISGEGPKIHLLAAIHIADADFYHTMQRTLESYDAVLFEGVKPAGLDPIDPELDDTAKADATTDRLNLLLEIVDRYHATTNELPMSFDDLLKSEDPRIAAIVRSIETDGWGKQITLRKVNIDYGDSQTQQIALTSTGADRKIGGTGADTDISLISRTYSPDDPTKPAPEGIQTQLANALHVSFQLDEMDTTNPDWINADIDIKELQEQLDALGEDNAMILKLIEGESFSAKLMGFVLKFVARSPTMSSMMKLVMMDMLAMMETTNMFAQFDAIEKVILKGRNATVIEYLKAELAAHPENKDIAIFYGAAHMPGIEEVITSELGYKYESTTWTPAMSVNTKDTGLTESQIKMMRKMIQNSLENQF